MLPPRPATLLLFYALLNGYPFARCSEQNISHSPPKSPPAMPIALPPASPEGPAQPVALLTTDQHPLALEPSKKHLKSETLETDDIPKTDAKTFETSEISQTREKSEVNTRSKLMELNIPKNPKNSKILQTSKAVKPEDSIKTESLESEINDAIQVSESPLEISEAKSDGLQLGIPDSIQTSQEDPETSEAFVRSEDAVSEVDAAELLRDAPLYPPLRHPEEFNDLALETSIEDSIAVAPDDVTSRDDVTRRGDDGRHKRSSGQDWDKDNKSVVRRVKTGDTILNIRGAVRDAIGDGGAAPPPRASSRLDAFVIRPAPAHRPLPLALHHPAMDQPHAAASTQLPSTEHELLVEAHSLARIACDVSNNTDLRWFKDNEEVSVPARESAGPAASMWRETGALVVARASRSDAGRWRCATRAANGQAEGNSKHGKPVHLLIYEPVRSVYLALDGRRLDAGNTWIPVRDKTVLDVRCVAEGGVPAPTLRWKLSLPSGGGSEGSPTLDPRLYLRALNTNHSIPGVSWSQVVVTAAREIHNATLVCAAVQTKPHTAAAGEGDDVTAKLEIRVTYPPSFVISRWPGFGVALVEGAAAALRCDVDANPPARAWWLRDDAHAASSSPPPLEEEDGGSDSGGSATLRWAALAAAHAGWYRCRATWLDTDYSSIGYYLNVLPGSETAPTAATEAELEPETQRVDVPLGGSAQLTCPKGSVGCWWRRVVGVHGNDSDPLQHQHQHKPSQHQHQHQHESEGGWSDRWAPAGSHHAHGVLSIKDAMYQEGGEYRCFGATAPDVNRVRELKRVTLRVTGAATATALSAEPAAGGWRLECGACGRQLSVIWVRGAGRGRGDGAPLASPAALSPDLAQHCWRAVLHVSEPDEVWCVAATPSGGAVAVFGRRAAAAPLPHSVRAPRPPAEPSPARSPPPRSPHAVALALATTAAIAALCR